MTKLPKAPPGTDAAVWYLDIARRALLDSKRMEKRALAAIQRAKDAHNRQLELAFIGKAPASSWLCPTCGEAFMQKNELEQHQLRKHFETVG